MEEMLFMLLRLGLGLSSCDREDISSLSAMTIQQWKELVKLSYEQGVAGILADGLQSIYDSLPSDDPFCALDYDENQDVRYDLFGMQLSYEDMNRHQISVLRDLAGKWHNAGGKVLLMKGQAHGVYYPNPLRRSPGDIDVFFLDSGYGLGNDVADSAGATVDTHWYKHSQIHYKGEMFENHLFFVTTREGKHSKMLNEELLSSLDGFSMERFRGSEVRIPPAGFTAKFMIYHSFSHFISEGLRLKQVLDWVMFVASEKDNLDWVELYEYADRYSYRTFLEIMNNIAVKAFGLDLGFQSSSIIDNLTTKVVRSIIYDKDYVFSSGKSGWTNRLHLIKNMFKYRWKYHDVYHSSVLKQLWYYASGYILHTE